jgi:hypothetical protein
MLERRVADPWERAPKSPLGDSCLPQTPGKRDLGEAVRDSGSDLQSSVDGRL